MSEVQEELDDVRPVENEDAIEADNETAEEAEEESAPSDEDAEDEAEKPKRRSRAEERINALTREKYEAQKQAEAYQQRVQEYESYLRQQQEQQFSPQSQFPQLADYDYDEQKYAQAVQNWNRGQLTAYQQQQENLSKQQQAEAMKQREAAYIAQKVQEGVAKYPDFQQKVFDPSLPPLIGVNRDAYQAVIESDSAVDIAYYLANNPQEVYAFASMSPVQAIKKVAQIEAQLASKPIKSHSLPKPPSKVSGNSESVKDPEKMSVDDWLKWRNNQIQSKR